MLTTDIQQDTYTGPVTLNPRWLRIPSVVKYSGLFRSRLYELIAEGSIKSICLKSHQNASRGVRLVDRESVDLFMERLKESVGLGDPRKSKRGASTRAANQSARGRSRSLLRQAFRCTRPGTKQKRTGHYQRGRRNPHPPDPLAFWRRYSA